MKTRQAIDDQIDFCKRIVCEFFTLTQDDLIGTDQKLRRVEARRICAYLLINAVELECPEVAQLMRRDEKTIVQWLWEIRDCLETNRDYCDLVLDMVNRVQAFNEHVAQIEEEAHEYPTPS